MSSWLDTGLLGRVRRIAAPWPCHLVGGAVRDHLLDRPAHDLDLVVSSGEECVAALAAALPARRIAIGGDRFAATRLVGEDFFIDLWDRGDVTMEDELARRDLTINSMAIDLADGSCLDPHNGRRDLAARLLRPTTPESFLEDPLRVLRLARFAAELPTFALAPGAAALAAQAVERLGEVAAERRREEFGRALRAAAPERALSVHVATGFYPTFVGGPKGASDAAQRLFLAARLAGERLLAGAARRGIEGVSIDPFTLHAALLLVAAGADVERLLDQGYVSRREARDITLTLGEPSLPAATPQRRWFLHRAAHVWPTALCRAASGDDEPSVEAIEDCLQLVAQHEDTIFNPAPLVRGDEVRELLDLRSGPEVGLATRRLRRQQIEGRLGNREEAVAWLLSERRSSSAD